MVAAGPFADYHHAASAARDIWFNKVDVNGWLESFAAHPEIGATSKPISKWSQEEQSAALSTATDSTFQELVEWNARYKEKFGFIFLICASGKGMQEILTELKKRYPNRPIVELENAAQEEMKIIEIRLSKLFTAKDGTTPETMDQVDTNPSSVAGGRIGVIGGHLTTSPKASGGKIGDTGATASRRSRPPITTHILDVAHGCPASGVEVHLEMWKGAHGYPSFKGSDSGGWVPQGSSITDSDGRSGALMGIVDHITPGYIPSGFFPYVSIVFEVRESQRSEHFHVPLLLSPFSFSTYRGS
ncbi:unnamed protein product [Spirodela intermedia]|uniref:2-oxo-4-hydroxy-4-carboxy-5-ureidoimidazoline decarboxylase n=1 Tax=Spirodela intermedia TaxID=51605 RepID=A0A7I8JHS3_SPIIN|nr:unnamed protein product [Spirodela intermedia]CAA6669688.1 unnamed protein product [Spirodela intermedia]